MQRHPIEQISRLKYLRKRGLSINELVRELKMPKTTIWHHVHTIKVSGKYAQILESKKSTGGINRKRRALERAWEEAIAIASGPHKYFSSLLAMLYWAEGNKNDFTFTNTDPEMIKNYISILGKCFLIDTERLSVIIRYFTGMDKRKCLEYWSSVTKISPEKINMYYNDGGKRGRSPYGICRITVKKGGYLFKVVQFLIKIISKEIQDNKGPDSSIGRAVPS